MDILIFLRKMMRVTDIYYFDINNIMLKPKRIFCDQSILDNILKPYKLNCRYLKNAYVEYKEDNISSIIAHGNFSIKEPCYINNTGHFNSVEFNICYNQLAYKLLAECIHNKLVPELSNFSLENFYNYQLSNVLIVNFQSTFHKLMTCHDFTGVVEVKQVTKKGDTLFIQSICNFGNGGVKCSSGKILIAISNLTKFRE